ncbi:MAG: MFS transporter [Candidatus Puniceispirillaceae bacterium]
MPSSQPPIFTYNSCSWMVYDWASSVLPTLHTTFVFAVYFTTILSPDNGTFAWAMMTAIAALATGLLAPVLGHLADKKGLVKKGLILTTCMAAIAVTGLWFAAPDARFAALALGLSGLAIFFSELAFIYYNSLLPKIAPASALGRISGYGWGLGYAGAILALLLVLGLFILPETPFFGLSRSAAEPVRASMVFAGLWLIVFSLPLFFARTETPPQSNKQPFLASLRQSWKIAISLPDMVRFLIARMAYNDGLITLFAFGGIYAANVFGFDQKDILIFAIGLNITAGIGAVTSGPLTDKWGAIRIIQISLAGLFGLGLVCLLTKSLMVFWAASLCLGIFIGPCQAASRVWVAHIAPAEHHTSLFGFLALSGKLTSFIGPFLYGWAVYITGLERAGMAIVLGLFVLGFVLLPRQRST